MKLAINTQYMENYGAHDWDGQGECPQYWKAKGGSTYVIERLRPDQAQRAAESGCPTLRSLLEFSNQSAREFIISITAFEDDAAVCEDWETPVVLTHSDSKWCAQEVIENDEYSFMNPQIARKVTTYQLAPEGQNTDLAITYVLTNGEAVTPEQFYQRANG